VSPERVEDRLQISWQDHVTGGRIRGGQPLPHLFDELFPVGAVDEFEVLIGGIENYVLDAAGLSQSRATQRQFQADMVLFDRAAVIVSVILPAVHNGSLPSPLRMCRLVGQRLIGV